MYAVTGTSLIIYKWYKYHNQLTSLEEAILVKPENFKRNKAFSLQLVTKTTEASTVSHIIVIKLNLNIFST